MIKVSFYGYLIITFILLSGCNGKENIVTKKKNQSHISDKSSYTGETVEYYKNGKKRIAFNYKDGKEDGLNISWHKNGKKKYESFLKNGDGKKTYWYESGEKKAEIDIRNWKMNGKHIVWFKNGKKQYEEDYKDDLIHGIRKNWNKEGELILDIKYRKGKYVKKTQK